MLTIPHEPPLRDMSDESRKSLAAVKVPQGPFDPAGPWKQNWAIFLSNGGGRPAGKLVMEKRPRPDGTFDLSADWHVQQTTKGFQHMLADVHCLADDLATPMSWTAQTRILKPNGQPIDDLTVKQEATVKDGVVEVTSSGVGSNVLKRYADQPLKAWSSTWSMLEAVQRLGGKEIKPLAFTLLEYMDARKNEQMLSSVGELALNLGGRDVKLRGYQQIGRGLLPMEYWLDEQQRTVMMLGRQRCFLAVEEGAHV